ncbi:hypothetical protein VNO77_44753 [Canavalia gladiata]|uniref:Uncharacterized protein n=1 Tax=Canavalia gladiata TaxID=3824 RepID=A0AAN9JWK6_CANGL
MHGSEARLRCERAEGETISIAIPALLHVIVGARKRNQSRVQQMILLLYPHKSLPQVLPQWFKGVISSKCVKPHQLSMYSFLTYERPFLIRPFDARQYPFFRSLALYLHIGWDLTSKSTAQILGPWLSSYSHAVIKPDTHATTDVENVKVEVERLPFHGNHFSRQDTVNLRGLYHQREQTPGYRRLSLCIYVIPTGCNQISQIKLNLDIVYTAYLFNQAFKTMI